MNQSDIKQDQKHAQEANFLKVEPHVYAYMAKQAARNGDIDNTIFRIKRQTQEFTRYLKEHWTDIQAAIFQGQESGAKTCEDLNTRIELPLNISFSVSRINCVDIHPADIGRIPGGNCIELYISCITQYANVLAMEYLYAHLIRADISPMLNIFKYTPFNIGAEIISELTNDQCTIRYDDLSVAYMMGVNELQAPIVNLIIQAPPDKLEKKIIKFETGADRVLTWCKFDIARLLINIIGEHAVVNYIGFIEFVPSDDMPSDTEFYELIDIRRAIEQCDGIANVTPCHGCGRHPLQGLLKQCTRCRKVRYCSVACQAIHWPAHKSYCPKV